MDFLPTQMSSDLPITLASYVIDGLGTPDLSPMFVGCVAAIGRLVSDSASSAAEVGKRKERRLFVSVRMNAAMYVRPRTHCTRKRYGMFFNPLDY